MNPNLHEIIQIAVVFDLMPVLAADGAAWTTHLRAANDVAYYETRIRPTRIEDAEPKALEVNGYAANPSAWASAPTFNEVAERLREMLEPAIVAGHCVAFDIAFIESEMRRTGVTARIGRHRIDTVTMAHEHLVPCGLKSLRLDDICSFVGVSNDGNHRALADALRCRAVHRRLARASAFDRLRWWLRNR